ncbi:uncharacterized protein BN580_00588 [Candidatus Colimorpha enterica]|uniref:Uncharacterized protein n=1 Tax=Candidatus Colimorpha enterica TaxID=3083063 RepID=R6UFW4_9BACT|nr:uncharacterized protein BN580_00588 [Candidatus Colimorpha enterica]
MNAQNRFSLIFRSVARLSLISAGTSVRRLFMSTASEADAAMSVPAPIAIPVSALVSAGASFIPSPTIAVLPSRQSFATSFSFPSGRTPAITSVIPTCFATAFAVFSLSPVSMTTRMPISRSCLTASGLSSLITSATAIIPQSLPPQEKNSGVLPSDASPSASLRNFSLTSV